METPEIKPDLETVNSTIDRIKYYSCLPAHIKEKAADLDNTGLKESIDDGLSSPAHVVNGSITAIFGRINIPDINRITKLYEISEPPLLLFNP